MMYIEGTSELMFLSGCFFVLSSLRPIRDTISLGYCKKDVTPVRGQWSYVFLALTHRYGIIHNMVNYGSCNGLLLFWYHAITWTNVGMLSIETLPIIVNEILIETWKFSLKIAFDS